MENPKGWTDTMAVGDSVYVQTATGGFSPVTYYLPASVVVVTKTQFVLDDGKRYAKSKLRPLGSRSYGAGVFPATPANVAESAKAYAAARDRGERDRALAAIFNPSRRVLESLDTATLLRIAQLMKGES